MFLGTQFLFAILHSKIGLLTKALSDKSLVLKGRAEVGEERCKMEANRRQTTTKNCLSNSWKTMILVHSPLLLDIVPIPVQNKLLLPGVIKGRRVLSSAGATGLPPHPCVQRPHQLPLPCVSAMIYWTCRSSTARAKHPQKHLKIFSQNQPALLIS